MGASKGASLWAAFEIVFLPRNKFKETRFQERLKAYTHCLANEQTYIEHQSCRKAVFSVKNACFQQLLLARCLRSGYNKVIS
ncbi:hypothetical protein [Paenibacillus contaminans]|uniref:Uncharacterized protein n=1 Tax=Paenibacillus contaminans TaxID=450362 RepID=A0A329MJE7_9BACL|nr:hypothetical protein [Paenibacillus contaminans]RAV19762.1 hypothetical protein DQG23_17610 [Paenibacillus contaminans]